MEAILKDEGFEGKEEDVFATRFMADFGIVRFKRLDDKDAFLNHVMQKGWKLQYKGNTVKVRDNDESKEDRIKGRAVSKVKRALKEKSPERGDISLDRKNGEVWLGSDRDGWQRVAKWDGERLKLKGEAKELEEQINVLIAERRKTDELSE